MEKNTDQIVVRALAEYQLFGDVEGVSWMTEHLSRAKTEGHIEGYDVFDAIVGRWGIRLVSFTADVKVSPKQLVNPKDVIKPLLDRIVKDTDVEVRWVGLP